MASLATMNEACEMISIRFSASQPLESDVIFADAPDAPGVYVIITGSEAAPRWAFAGSSPSSVREVLQWQLVASPNERLRHEMQAGVARFIACPMPDAAAAQAAQAFLVERLRPVCNPPAALVPQRFQYELAFAGADRFLPPHSLEGESAG